MKDFFANNAIQQELKEAVESARKYQRMLVPPDRMRIGATFRFPDASLPIRWVAIRSHGTLSHGTLSGYWYFIIADELPLVGTHDVELIDERDRGLLVARCKFGTWVHENDVDLHGFLSQLSIDSVDEILSTLKTIESRSASEQAENNKVPSLAIVDQELRVATDEDPEYQQWTDELKQVVQQVERRVRRSLVARHEFTDDARWSHLATVAERSSEYQRSSTNHIDISCQLPGKLFLLRNGNSLELRYCPLHSERPPHIDNPTREGLNSGSSDSPDKNEWIRVAEGEFLWLGVLSLVTGEVQLRVEGKELVIPIEKEQV